MSMRKCLFHIILFFALWFLPIQLAHAAVLVGFWPFEEKDGNTVFDQSTFSNDGQLTGAIRSLGKVGQGLTFGVAGGVTVPNSASLDSFPGGFTMSAWVKPAADSLGSVFFKWDRASLGPLGDPGLVPLLQDQLQFDVNTGLIATMNQHTSLGGFEAIVPNVITPNEWQYIAWTYDEAFQRLYVDGVQVFSAPFTDPWVGNNIDLLIGQHQAFSQFNFNGMIDESRIYSGALTKDEIIRDMNFGNVIPEPTTLLLFAFGLIGLAISRKP